MYTLHIANKNYSSWSLRPWLLMTELEIPFVEKLSVFKPQSNWKEFREFSPSGLVPCLLDENEVIWDSLAITEYLAEQYPEVWPEQKSARAWARSAAAEMHSGFSSLRNQCPMNCGVRIKLNIVDEALKKDISRLDELWNQGLSQFGGPFLAGSSFTAVDAFFAPVAFRIRTFGLALSESAIQYCNRLLSLEGVKSWERDALLESHREPGHEEDTLRLGTLISDFRQA